MGIMVYFYFLLLWVMLRIYVINRVQPYCLGTWTPWRFCAVSEGGEAEGTVAEGGTVRVLGFQDCTCRYFVASYGVVHFFYTLCLSLSLSLSLCI